MMVDAREEGKKYIVLRMERTDQDKSTSEIDVPPPQGITADRVQMYVCHLRRNEPVHYTVYCIAK